MQKNKVCSILLIEEEIYRTAEVCCLEIDHLIHCPAYSRFCQKRLLRLWSSWLLGVSKNGKSTVSLGDPLKRNSYTLLL